MKVMLLGAAGFIGTNLAMKIAENGRDEITLVDRSETFFDGIKKRNLRNVSFAESGFDCSTDFDSLIRGQDVIYHLVSTTVPTTSNQQIPEELMGNIVVTSKLLDACVRTGVSKVVFISSGGTVYGKDVDCPIKENAETNPISSYGLQKITIEKLLYLYSYMHGLDYRVVRLANPYGPYQRPNGVQGAVTTFTYKALAGEEIVVFGDGSIVRDYIFIEDAVRGILDISEGLGTHRIYNLGSGYGTSIRQVLETVAEATGCRLNITYREGRSVDVPVNYLDISRYEEDFGKLAPISLMEGIQKTAAFMKKEYNL